MTEDTATAPRPARSAWHVAGVVAAVIAIHGGLLRAAWPGLGQGSSSDETTSLTIATLIPETATVTTAHAAHPVPRPKVAPPRHVNRPTDRVATVAPPAPAPDAKRVADNPTPGPSATASGEEASPTAPSEPSPPPAAAAIPAPVAAPIGQPATAPDADTPPSDPAVKLARQAAPPESARWTYDASIKVGILSLSGSAWLNWQQDGQHYQAELQYQALGRTMQQTSTGTLSVLGLRPDAFEEKGHRTVFDHDAHEMRRDGATTGVALPPGTHDKLSVIIQLGSLLAALPDGPHPGDQWVIPVAGSSSIAPWTFRYVDEPSSDGTHGATATWQVAYLPSNPEDDQIRIWYARQPSGLPVRLMIRQSSGNAVDLRHRGALDGS